MFFVISTINICSATMRAKRAEFFIYFLKNICFLQNCVKNTYFGQIIWSKHYHYYVGPLTWTLGGEAGGWTPWTPRLLRPWYYNTSSVTMLDHLEWETLESRRIKNQLTMLFKIIHGLADFPASDYLTPANTRTRSNHSLKFTQFSSSSTYKCNKICLK